MKRAYIGLGIILIFLVSITSGCGEQEPEFTQDTGITTKTETKTTPAKTEIRLSQGAVEMLISPSEDKLIKGVVTITMTKTIEGTKTVVFAIQGPGIPSIDETGPNLGLDQDSSDGWSTTLDTTVYQDGEYKIYGVLTTGVGGEPPLGGVEAEVIIKNAGSEEKLEPPNIGFYKAVQLWEPDKNNERISEAKDLGANIVIINLFLDHKDGKVILPTGWQVYLESAINQAYRKGLAASISVDLPSDFTKSLPYREGSGIDLPDGYDTTALAENMRVIYRDLSIFAEEKKVDSLFVPIEFEEWIGRVFQDSREYWQKSSQFDQEVVKEIKKHYSGEIVGQVLGGTWGFGDCCYSNIPTNVINLKGYDALAIRTRSDLVETGPPAQGSYDFIGEISTMIEFTRDIGSTHNIKKVYVEVGGILGSDDKTKLYNDIFEKNKDKVDGFIVSYLVKGAWEDPESFEVANSWFKKI